MDERTALKQLTADLPHAGDDAAVVGSTAITTDMLHETTDFPQGTTRYTAGWRSVAASLSDLAAMGAAPTAAVAAYADTTFEQAALADFVSGAQDVCQSVGAEYVGGDLDQHCEFTVATTAIGDVADPVSRSGARVGDVVVVTGTFGRSAAALAYFGRGNAAAEDQSDADADVDNADTDVDDADVDADRFRDRANSLFQFEPRVEAGRTLRSSATAMMDSSDGLARSLHQLAEASNCGVALDGEAVPIDSAVFDVYDDEADQWEAAVHFGEDFELVAAVPESAVERLQAVSSTPLTIIGRVVDVDVDADAAVSTDTDATITVDGEPLADRGYTH